MADLTINRNVYLDGNLVFDACDYAVYQGRGTIYVNGTVDLRNNGSKICAKAISGSPCSREFRSRAADLLEIVAVNAGNVSPGYTLTGAGTYRGHHRVWSGGSTQATART